MLHYDRSVALWLWLLQLVFTPHKILCIITHLQKNLTISWFVKAINTSIYLFIYLLIYRKFAILIDTNGERSIIYGTLAPVMIVFWQLLLGASLLCSYALMLSLVLGRNAFQTDCFIVIVSFVLHMFGHRHITIVGSCKQQS